MSLSNEWFDYHLTPRGWEMGSNKKDFGKIVEKDPPIDRLLTVHCTERLSSAFSEMVTTEKVTFESENSSAVRELTDKFGKRP